MNKFLKRIFPVLLAALIVFSIGWYLLEYDPAFTRDVLLYTARSLEENGNHNASVWLYNVAYEHFGSNDEVAIELANKFLEMGNYSKAEYTLRKAIEDGGNTELYMALSNTYVQQGKLRDAVLMLENVTGDIKQKLEALRPAAPVASLPSGSYSQYLSIELDAQGNSIYVACDNDYPSSLTDAYTDPILLPAGETTLFAVSVGQNGLVSSLSVYTYIIQDVVEAVTFTDPGFEAALRKQLGYNSTRVIYSNTLWSLKELTLDDSVGSCTDLKWFPNLQTLIITGSNLDDTNALSKCTALLSLSISGSTLSTEMVHTIGSLRNLQELTLTDCGISYITPLGELKNLKKLDLSNNAIRDLSALSELTELTQLNLGYNALINLEGLEKLSALTALDVSYNSIVSTVPLRNMTSLQHLNISSNALRTLEGVDQLTQLKELYASHNELLELNLLINCLSLTHLDVSHNTLLDIDSISILTSLEVFNFSYNEISKLPVFAADCALRVIDGSYNQISSLKNLSGLANLTHIYMDYNEQISSISPLTSCPALKEVYVYGTKVRSVSALTQLGILAVYSPV